MNRKIQTLCVIVLMAALFAELYAQGTPFPVGGVGTPPPPPPPNPVPPNQIPIDGGILALIAAAVAYGYNSLQSKVKQVVA